MRVFVFNYRMFDEDEYFRQYSKEFGMEIGFTEDSPSMDNMHLVDGYDAVSIITTKIDAVMMDAMKSYGIRVISTRTIGYDHIDLDHAKSIGMAVMHVTYDPTGVAEYTVMGILAAVRRLKEVLARTAVSDFTFEGLMSRQLRDLTVGIIGAGSIGKAVMRDLSGFGCHIMYSSRHRNVQADEYGMFVPLDELLRTSDVVSLHLELNDDTRHIIDSDALQSMKDGALIVNTARGPLIDTEALIKSLESGHLGGAFIDVVEGEFGLYYNDCRGTDLSNHPIKVLGSMPNVILTHHMAFYYDAAIRDMVRNSLRGIFDILGGNENEYRIA